MDRRYELHIYLHEMNLHLKIPLQNTETKNNYIQLMWGLIWQLFLTACSVYLLIWNMKN